MKGEFLELLPFRSTKRFIIQEQYKTRPEEEKVVSTTKQVYQERFLGLSLQLKKRQVVVLLSNTSASETQQTEREVLCLVRASLPKASNMQLGTNMGSNRLLPPDLNLLQ